MMLTDLFIKRPRAVDCREHPHPVGRGGVALDAADSAVSEPTERHHHNQHQLSGRDPGRHPGFRDNADRAGRLRP